MRRLVMCCDGTWNTPGQLAPSNVRRLYNALVDTATDGKNGEDQLTQYQSGVGTDSGGPIGWLLGGAAGVGLSSDVMDAYHWLTTTYRPGDKIALFGFSRGAFTARSLAGMIAACGLIDTTCLDEDEDAIWRQIGRAYHRRYRLGRDADPGWSDGLRFTYHPERADPIPVDFVGVWDTVGALGIPDTLGWLNLLDPPGRHAFHNLKLNPQVRHGRHAVALDEWRGPFTPTLWSDPAPGQDVKQVWFPGSHMDVGGGHPQTGLSDGALKWMIDESRAAVGLEFRKEVEDQIRPDALGMLHDDNQGVYGLLEPLYEPLLRPLLEPFFEPRPRAAPLIGKDRNDSSLHESVYERHDTPPITSGPYRRTRALAPGESGTVSVSARDPWNWTGLYLDAGDYTFAATGQWTDLTIASGPAGTTGWRRFHPREAGRLAGTVIGQGERLFRRVTGNPRANFLLTRRDEDMPWMALIGVVANDAIALEGGQDLHQRIPIGAGTNHRVCRSGYLYAFANDAWSFYGNNRGSVQLTVTRNQ
ncbi:DUF2235 domain-containing protein [Rhodococcus koreensis]